MCTVAVTGSAFIIGLHDALESLQAVGPELGEEVAQPAWTSGEFGQAASLLAPGTEGMLLYDMDVAELGPLRVAEHFTVENGKITRIRQVHDTAALRAAGFVG
jgi:hypothetical protein